MRRREEAHRKDERIVCDRPCKRQNAGRVIDPGGLVFRGQVNHVRDRVIPRFIIRAIEITEEDVFQIPGISKDAHVGLRLPEFTIAGIVAKVDTRQRVRHPGRGLLIEVIPPRDQQIRPRRGCRRIGPRNIVNPELDIHVRVHARIDIEGGQPLVYDHIRRRFRDTNIVDGNKCIIQRVAIDCCPFKPYSHWACAVYGNTAFHEVCR